MSWAQRLKCVFNIDLETCSLCGGAMRSIEGAQSKAQDRATAVHLSDLLRDLNAAL